MKYILTGILALACALFMAFSVHAQEAYQYIDLSGNARIVYADSYQQALAQATDKNPRSGVMLLGGVGGNPELETYQYVTLYGTVQNIQAPDPQTALDISEVRAAHSGVMEVRVNTSTIPTNYPVPLNR